MSVKGCINEMRILWIILVVLCTVYAPIELTRVIVINELILDLHAIPHWQFIAELTVFWNFYVAGIVIVGRKIWLKSRK